MSGARPDHRVVIIGGGFGGLYAARALRRVPVSVTLVDRRNFHLFQPLLYQVATGGLSPGDIAAPLRAVLRRHRRTSVVLGEVVDLDPAAKRVVLRDGEAAYDTLLVAAGAENFYFGRDEWRLHAPGLKSVEEATEIRRRVLLAFEAAEREVDPESRRALLTFVVVGGGATGVELAGALAEIASHTLRGEFRHLDPGDARIIMLEGADRVLPPFAPDLSARAQVALHKLGVVVRTATMVRGIDARGVTVAANDREERIESRTVLWAAGVRPNALAKVLAERTGSATDKSGRLIVGPYLTLPGHDDIFVIGDMAHAEDAHGAPLPGLAPVAMQQGKYVAETIARRVANASSDSGSDAEHRWRSFARHQRGAHPFRYRDRGTLATIGRSKAVADLRIVRLSGFVAWVLWLFVHLLYLVEFENRVLVLIQWAWSYATWNRGARLITGEHRLPDLHGDEASPAEPRSPDQRAEGVP